MFMLLHRFGDNDMSNLALTFGQERLNLAEATIEERIARLESMLARLGVQRNELEKKIADTEARRSRDASNDG